MEIIIKSSNPIVLRSPFPSEEVDAHIKRYGYLPKEPESKKELSNDIEFILDTHGILYKSDYPIFEKDVRDIIDNLRGYKKLKKRYVKRCISRMNYINKYTHLI